MLGLKMVAMLIAMISAEIIKSVRIAPTTVYSSTALGSPANDSAFGAGVRAACGTIN